MKIRSVIRSFIYSNEGLFQFYMKFLWKPKDGLEGFLNDYSSSKMKFIQIGANDGLWNDPIYKFVRRDKWRGILVEPQRHVFERLQRTYRGVKSVHFENCACDAAEGEKILYKIGFTDARWASGLSSFNRVEIQKMIDAGYVLRMARQSKVALPTDKNMWIAQEVVRTTTIERIIRKYNFIDIDLLMIDTEGYDFEIIKSLPFELAKPRVIVYEHSHFTDGTKNECAGYLERHGYYIRPFGSDTVAFHN